MPAVELKGVRSGVVRHFDLTVDAGEAVIVSGPRGTGKHRILQLALGLTDPDRGAVRVLGSDLAVLDADALHALRARCGFVPSRTTLVSNLSVFDNLALPLRYHGLVSEAEVRARIEQALEEVGMKHISSHRPAQLTPVEAQLAALARVRASRAEVVLLEDPFEGMDDEASDTIDGLIRTLLSDAAAVLITTHAVRLATSYDGRYLRIPNARVVVREARA